ncbi:ComEA family DNA-binding protein [Cohnella mopanensis]|uniref:ComEA family DNA-binding protein n=1 Tax=Cohnella mopanensis TaxID=2911966 RepID=UPI001EF9273F|nr:ComEA family DNA-binding protein [Cohnella mopanensis]
MRKARPIGLNNKIALILTLTGVAILAYAFYSNAKSSSIDGWIPVNEPLQAVVESLSVQPSAPTAEVSVTTSPSPAAEASATSGPSPTTEHIAEPQLSTSAPATEESQPNPNPKPTSSTSAVSSNLIDLNRATQKQLESLPGIGPSKAKAIIAYRDQHNGFRSVDQLMEVKGIGPKVYGKISALVQIAP